MNGEWSLVRKVILIVAIILIVWSVWLIVTGATMGGHVEELPGGWNPPA